MRLAPQLAIPQSTGGHTEAAIRSVVKTTIEISDPLLRKARKLAEREGVTLRALVGRGLRHVVAETRPGGQFKLRRATFPGRGLQADLRDASRDKLRDLVYESRGG